MLRNLQIEWMKIKNYRVFQVFSILYMLGIILIIYIFYRLYLEVQNAFTNGMSGNSDMLSLFTAKNIWKTVIYWSSLLLYLPGMVIINLFTNEVNFKTHRQNIIDGWKRETFIYTKIGLIVAMSLVITIMNLVATIVMCNITEIDFTFDGAYNLFYCFVQAFVYLMFALFLATLFRRSGVAIIVFFAYGILLEWLLLWGLREIDPAISYYLPLQASDSLTLLPFMGELFRDLPSVQYLLIASAAYAGLYIWLTVRKYKYDDL